MKTLLHLLFCFTCVGLTAQTQFGTDFVGGGANYFAGSDVDITADGKRMVFGEPGAFSSTGIVKVYEESGNGWTQVGSDIFGPGGTSFGISVAISDDGQRIAIGSIGNSMVTIYQDYGGVWTSFGQQIIAGASGDEFGWEIDLSGDGNRLAVTTGYGSVTRVYEASGYSWSKLGADIPSASSSDVALSADGTRVAVTNGASGATVYDESGGSWTQVGSTLTGFSTSVALSADGSRVVSGNGGNGFSVYEETGGAWSALGSVSDPVGSAVAISGDGKSIVSGGINTNEVRQYEEMSGVWTQVGATLTKSGTSYGGAVATTQNGGRFILGACCDYSNFGLVQTYNTSLNTSNTNLEKRDIGQLAVYPNPSSGNFQIQLEGISVTPSRVSITDGLGRVVWETVPGFTGKDWTQSVSLPTEGLYTVVAAVEGAVVHQLITVVK